MKKIIEILNKIGINFGRNRITDSYAEVEILGNSDILDGQSREIVKNRKPTVFSGLPGHQQARESSSTLSVIVANNQEVSSPSVDTLSQPATPTAHTSYQLICRYCNGKNQKAPKIGASGDSTKQGKSRVVADNLSITNQQILSSDVWKLFKLTIF